MENREYLAKLLAWAAELIFYRNNVRYFSKALSTYTRRYTLDNDLNPGPKPSEFDDFLYDLAEKIWPYGEVSLKQNYILSTSQTL